MFRSRLIVVLLRVLASAARVAEGQTTIIREQIRVGQLLIAVCMFGKLPTNRAPDPNLHGSRYQEMKKAQAVMETMTFPTQFERIIRRNRGHGQKSGVVDVFVHTWATDPSDEELIRRLYQPKKALFGLGDRNRTRMAHSGSAMFASIQLVTRLKRLAELEQGWQYDWVLYMRYDTVWLSDFVFAELNPRLFYVANWCVFQPDVLPRKIAGATPRVCFPFDQLFDPSGCQTNGVPDYYFAANSSLADAVFEDIQDAKDAQRFEPRYQGCCCNHAVMNGRLRGLGLWNEQTMGRYLMHHVDVDIVRSEGSLRALEPARYDCYQQFSFEQFVNGTGSLVREPFTCDSRTPTLTSCCTAPDVFHCVCSSDGTSEDTSQMPSSLRDCLRWNHPELKPASCGIPWPNRRAFQVNRTRTLSS